MAITRTPIVDDDGTGTTGTILNNAWKQELYNQIDANGTALVYGASGTNSAATAGTVLGQTVIPALGARDTLKVFASIYQNAGAGTGMSLAVAGQVVLLDLSTIAGGSMANGAQCQWEITIRSLPGNDDRYLTLTAMGGTDATHTGIAGARNNMTTGHWLAGGWTLQLFSGGQAAGASQLWVMSVYRFFG